MAAVSHINMNTVDLEEKKRRMWTLVDECRTRMQDGKYNHVSMFNPACKLFIDSKYEVFMDLYNELYAHVAYGIGEMPGPYSHVLVDIDIKVPYPNGGGEGTPPQFLDAANRLYTPDQLVRVVKLYQEQLRAVLYDHGDAECMRMTRDYLENEGGEVDSVYLENAPKPDLTAFVLEKEHDYVYKGHRKSGFHIHFPNVILSAHHIKSFVHSQVYQKVQAEIPNSTDDCMCNKPVLLYGSRKSPEMESYRLTRVVDEAGHVLKPDDFFYGEYMDLPRFFRMNSAERRTSVIRPYLSSKVTYTAERVFSGDEINYDYNFDENLEEITTMLNMLSDDRATDHDKWLEIGWVLFNISGASDIGYKLWVEFSKRTKDPSKFDDSVCSFEWGRMHRGRYTARTLMYYASIDSPDKYKQYKQKNIKDKYIQHLRDTDTDLAEILQIMFGDSYKCANIDKDLWYFFHNHRWHRMDGAHDLRRKIDIDLKQLYINCMADCKRRRFTINKIIARKNMDAAAASDDEDEDGGGAEHPGVSREEYMELLTRDADDLTSELEPIDNQMNKIQDIIKSLGMTARKNTIIKECRFRFYDRMFCDLIDENPNLICFNNGVYDLEKLQFREGRPVDYISKTTGYDYVPRECISDSESQEIEDFMRKLYPDPLLCEFMWQNDSSNLIGGNFNKLFVTHSGPRGNNGKSKKQNLVEYSFGEYCIHLPTSLLIGKRTGSSACTPELSRAPGARVAFVQEPDNKDEFQCGIIKELTGNDRIYVRALFAEGREVILMFKLHLTCNYLPRVHTTDPAFWNRMIVVPYDSVFVPPVMCPVDAEEQYKQKIFPEDKNISNRLRELKHVYMALLIQKHKDMINGKCQQIYAANVPSINKATQAYKESADIIQKFVTANYVRENDMNASIPVDDMFKAYKLYLNDMGYSNSSKIDCNEFNFQLNSKFSIINEVVYGIRQKTIQLAAPAAAAGSAPPSAPPSVPNTPSNAAVSVSSSSSSSSSSV